MLSDEQNEAVEVFREALTAYGDAGHRVTELYETLPTVDMEADDATCPGCQAEALEAFSARSDVRAYLILTNGAPEIDIVDYEPYALEVECDYCRIFVQPIWPSTREEGHEGQGSRQAD